MRATDAGAALARQDGDMPITVRRTTADDWQRMRKLRLQALHDTPIAFGQTVENALAMTERDWRSYASRGQDPQRTFVVAIDDDARDETRGDFVGMMGGALDRHGGAPYLVGVFVAPSHRGKRAGVADLLLEAIEEWARAFDNRLQLDVHEDNARALRFYESRGFTRTGLSEPYVFDRTKLELNMIKRLG
jgi:GNAT superfamily N-acetyltransferase